AFPASDSMISLIGREPELTRLMALKRESQGHSVWVRIVGETGVGKTRLLNEFARRCSDDGDIVVCAGPHSTLAPVPYWTVKTLLEAILTTKITELTQERIGDLFVDPLARSGLSEILDPSGIPWLESRSRAGAAAAALAASLQDVAGHTHAA